MTTDIKTTLSAKQIQALRGLVLGKDYLIPLSASEFGDGELMRLIGLGMAETWTNGFKMVGWQVTQAGLAALKQISDSE